MKLVREYIDFERGKDPKRAMKIGAINTPIDGMNYIEVAKKIYAFLPEIIGTKEIPEDILQEEGHWIKYDDKILEYLFEHHSEIKFQENIHDVLKGNPFQVLHRILLDKGFQGLPEENDEDYFDSWQGDYGKLDENLDFERGQDPRSVLGKYTPGEIIKYNFEDLDKVNDDYPEYFIKFGNYNMVIAYHVISAYGPQFKWIPAINFDVDEISKFDKNHIVPVEGWELEQLEDKIANSKEGQEILKFLKDEHNVLMKKHLYESMDFERGIDPKSALDVGSRRMIPENWEHLARDLSPYFIDYTTDGDIIYLEIDGELDPRTEAIPIIDGYLETWATVEDVQTMGNNCQLWYKYKIRIKPEYMSKFEEVFRGEEMPY